MAAKKKDRANTSEKMNMAAKDKRELYRQQIIVHVGAVKKLKRESNLKAVAEEMLLNYELGYTRYNSAIESCRSFGLRSNVMSDLRLDHGVFSFADKAWAEEWFAKRPGPKGKKAKKAKT